MASRRTLPSRLACLLALVLLACSPPESLSFSAAEETTRPAPAPRIALTVRETAGVARAGEVLSTGVPLPRSLGARDTRWFAVTDSAGRPVPAEFRVLARWNAGLEDREAPIQWVLVTFPAAVGAKQKAAYSLSVDGSVANPPPPAPLTLTRKGDRITVDTGAAVFSLSGEALFHEILSRGSRLVTGSGMSLATPERTAGHSAVRQVRIEHAGPLSAVVVVEGAYDLPPVGKGGFGSLRRYVFTAGSPTAVVRQAVAWEGNLACNGCVATEDGMPNGVRLERVRDTLDLALGDGPRTATVVGNREAAAISEVSGSGPAWVRQVQRPDRHAKLRFEAAAGSKKAQGDKADGGILAVSGSAGTVAVALDHLHRYEPQALRLLEDGRLAVDLADGPAWLAHHQGMFATFAVSALPAAPARAEIDRLVWAPLNRPLRAWADAAWFAASDAVGELPVGPLPKGLAAYDKLVLGVLERTVEEVDAQGIAGLMTFGLYPRYWGGKVEGDLRCKNDPTPQEAWDEVFWCGRWADYHNTLATAPFRAMRSGEVEWLDELAFPGALRMLHTLIMQCAPGDTWFYCGQAPAGYGGYRADFNSSHAYFDNLFLYYWLTGDSTVVETLRRGGESMRRRMCGSPPCGAGDPPDKSSFTGRVSGQWLAAFRFLGLASGDASFLDDWRTGLARAVTHHYLEAERGGRRYGFLGKSRPEAGTPYETGPMWQIGFYDAEGIYQLMRDTGDAPIGDPPVRPSQVLEALARSIVELEAREWPQRLDVEFSGSRRGGRLGEIRPKGRPLYGPEKSGAAALLVRAGQQAGDKELLAAGKEMVDFTLTEATRDRVPLGKLQGQYLTRLHAAVARLANGPPAD